MSEAQKYYLSAAGHLMEGEELGRIGVYLASDYDQLKAELASRKVVPRALQLWAGDYADESGGAWNRGYEAAREWVRLQLE